jgi:ABC-type protease/lipase transport system fused ATPase/permease subunit
MVEAQRRGGETIMAMGMGGALAQRWARSTTAISQPPPA